MVDGVIKDTRITDPVEPVRQASVFPHVHDHLHGFPGPASVGAAAHADVNILLQILAVVVAVVINGNQGPFVGGHQSGYPVGIAAVLAGSPQHQGRTEHKFFRRLNNYFSPTLKMQLYFIDTQGGEQVGILFQVKKEPGHMGSCTQFLLPGHFNLRLCRIKVNCGERQLFIT